MKAQELRIGNWLKLPEDHYGNENLTTLFFQINSFSEGSTIVHWAIPSIITGGICHSGSYLDDGVEPIPLTEKWLDRFGRRVNGGSYNIDFNSGVIEIDLELKTCWLHSFDFEQAVKVVFPEYVHQLQNLGYSLQFEELYLKD